jgi:assimilatory nitrate reductase catalytic subunit
VMLSGRSTDGLASAGPVVCACFGVGLAAIRVALQSGAATDVEGIGAALRAGTNCGSCLPEIKRIVLDAGSDQAAAKKPLQPRLASSHGTREPTPA